MRFRAGGDFALALLVALALLASSARAGAQEAGGESERPVEDLEAQQLFEAARLALRQGRFEEALERFERAYELSPRAEMLYNIGYAADRAGHAERAIEAYEAFLVERPEHEERLPIEARVAVLRRGAEVTPTELPAPVDPEERDSAPAPPPPSHGGERIWIWVLGGLGLATGLAAGGLYLHANLVHDELAQTCAPSCARSEVDPLRAEVLASQILFPLAGAALIGALVAFFVEAPAQDSSGARLLLGPTGGALHVSF